MYQITDFFFKTTFVDFLGWSLETVFTVHSLNVNLKVQLCEINKNGYRVMAKKVFSFFLFQAVSSKEEQCHLKILNKQMHL